ncbi:DUF882 domain-containing protein [Mesorhizobium sp. NPDC059054]|uniref:DUF882 domain-containing protein n=1 Tax=Mesorhizobium sp. NPDC059054 TaxID=3346711 RepID=UPI0036A041BA
MKCPLCVLISNVDPNFLLSGYYSTSGSPFVHLDVGHVRAWPRMSRPELAHIFPNGRHCI